MAGDGSNGLVLEPLQGREGRVGRLLAGFRAEFGGEAAILLRVPGRVNLIGEHIDYCGYAVHPMAIEQDILVAVGRTAGPGIKVANMDPKYGPREERSVQGLVLPPGPPAWWAYFLCGVKGVSEEVAGESQDPGIHCLVEGCIPPSAGLSSSSALVVGAALAALWAFDRLDLGRQQLASLCARAERFIGTQGGGMDQAIELMAVKGSAKLIEFRPLRGADVQLPRGGVFVVANSLEEKNKAASNDFNTRVVECRLAGLVLAKQLTPADWKEAVRLSGVQEKVGVEPGQMVERVEAVLHKEDYTLQEVLGLLGVDLAWLQSEVLTPNTRDLVSFRLHQRAMHVYSEAARVYQFRDVCSAGGPGALASLGGLMADSHASCRDLYQCSSPGLDELVTLAGSCGALGARLTGAGWGGCIVALVPEERAQGFVAELQARYYTPRGVDTEEASRAVFVTGPGAGAQLWAV